MVMVRRVRRQPRPSTKVWTPADSAGRKLRWTPIADKPSEAQTPPEYWIYFDSLPANVRGALNDAPNQDMFMALYKVVLDKFPWNPHTGKWTGSK